jgi:formate dehydrogenase subunit gamma
MSDSQARMGKRGRRFRAMLLGIVLVAVSSMALPLAGYLYTAAVHAEQTAGEAGVNPRSEYWRDVRGGMAGYTAVTGQETNVLIQSRGQVWREIRNGPIATLGALLVLGVIVGVLAFHFTKGGAKLEHRTGRKVLRWPALDRALHWYTATLFVILAITGMSFLWGRAVLIPVLGKEGFAAWAAFAKPVHNYLALFFAAGLIVMLLKWFKHNVWAPYDSEWLKEMGGYMSGKHPPAGFANAGEKLYYWTLVIAGAGIVISGFFPLFPNLGFTREAMQNANIVHGICSLVVIAFVCLHIYLGTAGSEGAFEGMWTGEVDEGWAKQHHSVWLEEVRKQGGEAAAAKGDATGTSAPASA